MAFTVFHQRKSLIFYLMIGRKESFWLSGFFNGFHSFPPKKILDFLSYDWEEDGLLASRLFQAEQKTHIPGMAAFPFRKPDQTSIQSNAALSGSPDGR
jgi:hypothetical protein